MLSRVEDVRVFESSEDVIIRSSSRRSYSCHQQLNGVQHQLRNRVTDKQIEVEEDEQLHPQHPYRMRKRVLQQEYEDFNHLEEVDDEMLVPSRKQESNKPMEFVFLSSGEIRAREDCPPGLELPKLQQDHDAKTNRRLEYQTEAYSSEEVREYQGQNRRSQRVMKASRQQVRRQPVARQRNTRFASSPSSSSSQSESSLSKDADVSSDDNESLTSKVSEESQQRLREERAEFQAQTRRQARNAESRVSEQERFRVKTPRSSVKRTPTRSLKLDHLRIEEDEMSDHASDRVRSSHRSASIREEKSPSSDDSRESRQRPAPLSPVSPLEDTNDVPTRRTKRSPKMEVSHLDSNEPTPKLKSKATSSATREETTDARLESELQKEKKRVLEKMTQLLDEQGKNQQLRDRVEALEAQLAAKESETSNTIREHEVQTQSIEKKQAELEEQVRLQEATIARLKNDKDQLKAAVKQLKKTASNPPSDQHLDSNKATNLRTELDDMTRVLEDFLAKVERWKDKTKKELQNCEDMSDLPALLEQKWLKFPQFPGVSARPHKESSSPLSEQQSTPGTEEQDDVLFLKKRLRQREEELRQTHVKFVELKEICARQCVREADLQNFINEHRLRGNLIIRKNSDTKPNEVATNQESVPDEHQDERRSANSKLKMISSRGTNTPASYHEDEDNFVNDEYSDNQEDNDEYEEGEEYGYPVRAPKVFVQVGHEGVYEHASSTDSAVAQKLAADRRQGKRKKQQQRVERIRLVPSPSLAQRYERVPTPTTTTRRKKCTQQSLPQSSSTRPHPDMMGDCPPGCGSRPSFLNRKTPTAARTKTVKRSVSTTTSRGAVGVVRPWM
ncbi:hypothetical protein PI124_g6055 [Phytophthora idaei]|nr:hypothetical protein PI125_g7103 [Phytophthora idaei]KAG3156819.1 hypothetical protein PI126_g8596 [Phytophthora idaei]KAG3249269.1 hypothetical protein PI124_g6055 [Phytophthora idaei]